jgi:glycosyltransferase 2 family protein
VFRLFYLIIPFIIALVVILIFERSRFLARASDGED